MDVLVLPQFLMMVEHYVLLWLFKRRTDVELTWNTVFAPYTNRTSDSVTLFALLFSNQPKDQKHVLLCYIKILACDHLLAGMMVSDLSGIVYYIWIRPMNPSIMHARTHARRRFMFRTVQRRVSFHPIRAVAS